MFIIIFPLFCFSLLRRIVCSQKTSLTQLFMFTGRGSSESRAATAVVNAGTSLLMARNVHLLFQLTVSCTCGSMVNIKVLTASAMLRGIATTSTKEGCAWDSGSVTVPDMETLTPTQAGIQCPGSLLKRFQNHKLRSQDETTIPASHKSFNNWTVNSSVVDCGILKSLAL